MQKTLTQKLLLTALFTALTAAGAILHIGDASLQSMFAVAAGLLLGPVWGPVSQLLYVGMGVLGVPIFLNGGGFTYVVSPTFGYLLGMILAAFLAGILTEKTQWNVWLISALSLLSVYVIGIPYSYFYFSAKAGEISFLAAVAMGVVYLPMDLGKWFVVSPLANRLIPVLRKDLYE